jgi:hypothetical protein
MPYSPFVPVPKMFSICSTFSHPYAGVSPEAPRVFPNFF